MVNNDGSTQRVTIMARKNNSDEVWNDIFDSLVLDNEPPFEYIKNVIITTKTGLRLRVSAVDFAQILERERFLTPDESDILSCKLAINFDKLRKDVDDWADRTMYSFDNDGKLKPTRSRTAKSKEPKKRSATKTNPTEKAPKKTPAKPKPAEKKTTKKTAKKPDEPSKR